MKSRILSTQKCMGDKNKATAPPHNKKEKEKKKKHAI
jgi:hypothetical protein